MTIFLASLIKIGSLTNLLHLMITTIFQLQLLTQGCRTCPLTPPPFSHFVSLGPRPISYAFSEEGTSTTAGTNIYKPINNGGLGSFLQNWDDSRKSLDSMLEERARYLNSKAPGPPRLFHPPPDKKEWKNSSNFGNPLKIDALANREKSSQDVKNTFKRTVDSLKRTITDITKLVNSLQGKRLTIVEGKLLQSAMRYHHNILEVSADEMIYCEKEIKYHILELFRAQMLFEHNVSMETDLIPAFLQGLSSLPLHRKFAKRLMLKYYLNSSSESLETLLNFPLTHLDPKEHSEIMLAKFLESFCPMCQVNTLPPFKSWAVAVSMYEKVMSGNDLHAQDWHLVDLLQKKEQLLSKQDWELVEQCVASSLIYQLSHNDLLRKKVVWKKFLSDIELKPTDESNLFTLINRGMISTTSEKMDEFQKDVLQRLKARKIVSYFMRSKLEQLVDIDHTLECSQKLTPEQQSFLGRHFEVELKEIRKWIEDPHGRNLFEKELSNESMSHIKAYKKIHIKDIIPARTCELSIGKEFVDLVGKEILISHPKAYDKYISSFLMDLKRDTYIISLIKPFVPRVINIMQKEGLNEIKNMFKKFVVSKQLKDLAEKMSLGSTHSLKNLVEDKWKTIVHQLTELEQKRMLSMSITDKGEAMLNLMKHCQIYPISSHHNNLWKKLEAHEVLDHSEIHELYLLGDQYQSAIINTLSEYDLALSHLLWLDETGTQFEQHQLQDMFLKDPLETSRLKFTLKTIGYLPMEKYILFCLTQHHMEGSLERTVLKALEAKLTTIGYLSHYENWIRAHLNNPNWRQGNFEDMEMAHRLHKHHLESQKISPKAEKIYDALIKDEHCSLDMIEEALDQDEIKHIRKLHAKITHLEGIQDDCHVEKDELQHLLQQGENRYMLIKEPRLVMYQLQFNKTKMLHLKHELENLMKDFFSQKYKAEENLRSLYWVYQQAAISMTQGTKTSHSGYK